MSGLKRAGLTAGVAALALLSACGEKDKAPTGQVVATVNGEDITVHELNGELQTLRAPADAPKKQVEQAALQRVIERKMLADVAKKRGLDKNPQYILAQRRVDEGLLVQALQADIAKAVPRTTREAAQKFIEENPQFFAERKIYNFDQIQFLRQGPAVTLDLTGAKTMADVVASLTAAKVPFQRTNVPYDGQSNPNFTTELTKILKTKPDEPILSISQPQGAPAPLVTVLHVVGSKDNPFIGEKAIAAAQQVVQRLEIQKALAANLKKFTDAAKPGIKYAAGYAPPAAPAAAPAAGAKPVAAPAGPPPA